MGRKKLTHDEFLERLLQTNEHYVNGNIVIIGKYVGSNKPILCHCNVHDVNWSPTPNQLWIGQGCSICAKESLANQIMLTHEEFIEKLLNQNKYYDNNEFELIGEYTGYRNKIKCKCNKCSHEWEANIDSLLKGYKCHRCNMNDKKYKLSQEEFLTRLKEVHNDNIIVLDKYKGMSYKINFQCSLGHIFPAEPHNVLRGSGCPFCAGKALLVGFNDLWTTRPDIAVLLKNPEDGYKHVKSSKEKVDFICPDCGRIVNKRINDVYNHGFSCSRCSDGISYPNKFARSFLDQLPIDNYICEYHPDWAKSYFYDNYFEYNNKKYILEMDGGFHYKDVVSFNKSLSEIQNIDKIKTELANQNGIKVIRIDCQESDCDYIKNNILSSDISYIFDLSNIDWDMCNKTAHKNILKQACELYASGIIKLKDIANIIKVHDTTVRNYLKIGTKYGWCNYDAKKSTKELAKYRSNTIPIILIDNDNNIIQNFNSIHDCCEKIKEQYGISLWRQKLTRVCKTHEAYHGFNFRFANEIANNN